MTANAMQGDREECLAAGVDDYVTTSIRVDALVEAWNNATTRKEDSTMPGQLIDMDVFNELKDAAGEDFVGELVGTFFEEAPGMLADLRAAQAVQNKDAFRRAAHSLKSNSNTFGALRLAEMARDLELGGLIVDAGPVDALEAEYQHTAAALKGLIGG